MKLQKKFHRAERKDSEDDHLKSNLFFLIGTYENKNSILIGFHHKISLWKCIRGSHVWANKRAVLISISFGINQKVSMIFTFISSIEAITAFIVAFLMPSYHMMESKAYLFFHNMKRISRWKSLCVFKSLKIDIRLDESICEINIIVQTGKVEMNFTLFVDSSRNEIWLRAVFLSVELLGKWIRNIIYTSGYLSDYSSENYSGECFLFAFTNSSTFYLSLFLSSSIHHCRNFRKIPSEIIIIEFIIEPRKFILP